MSKAGVHGHFGSEEALQLATIRHALSVSQRDVVAPSDRAPDGLPRLWALCVGLTSYHEEIGLHGGDFWVTVANEYDSRSGPVRDTVEAIMSRWMRRLEDLISAAVRLGQLTPCDPAQLAFEIQALLDAGGHQGWLYHDPKAPARARAAIHRRLDELRTPHPLPGAGHQLSDENRPAHAGSSITGSPPTATCPNQSRHRSRPSPRPCAQTGQIGALDSETIMHQSAEQIGGDARRTPGQG